MLRSHWKGALLVALAWASAARGQQPGAPAPASPYAPRTASGPATGQAGELRTVSPEYRTVQEKDRPPLKCRVLRGWRMPGGAQACDLECVPTGEMLTVVETGPAEVPGTAPGSRPQAASARIFHWGRHKTRPASFPAPPGAAPAAVASRPQPAATTQAPAPKPLLLPAAPPPAPSKVAEAPRPVPTQAPVSRPLTPPAPPRPEPTAAALAPAPVQPSSAQPAPRTVVEAPRPSDWRQSWGNDERQPVKPAPASKPAPAVAQAPTRAPKTTELPKPPASRSETSSRPDPLANPQNYLSRSVTDRMPSLKPDTPATPVATRLPPPPAPPTITQVGTPPAPRQLPRPQMPARTETRLPPPATPPTIAPVAAPVAPAPSETAFAPPQGKVPLGAQSVLAASNGLERPVQYVPVPVVTMPERTQLPLPPVPQIPQAPQPNEKLLTNAFTPPMPPDAPGGGPGYPPMGHGMMQAGYPMMPPGYNPMMAQARYPMHPGMMPPGYPMLPPGYGVQPAGYPPYGNGPMMQPGYVPGRGMVPYGYQGPMPPNPFAGQPMPINHGSAGWGQARYPGMGPQSLPGMTAAQAHGAQQIEQMIYTLTTSAFPSQREWAAHNLAACDWHNQPRIVQVLTTAAKSDQAPTVRAGCVHALARMQVSSEPVLAVLQQLKSDTDPRVRVEVEQALARLNPATAPAAPDPNAIQPARGGR
jgi:hypothetical protein